MATFKELLVPVPKAEITKSIFSLLEIAGFPVTYWGSGSVARTLIDAFAQQLVDVWETVGIIASSASIRTASDEWLTAIADEFYGLVRFHATPAYHNVPVACPKALITNPITLAPNAIQLRARNGTTYVNVSQIYRTSPSPQNTTFVCETLGLTGNVPSGSLSTILRGGTTVSVGTSGLVYPGAESESDASLRSRVQTRWVELGGSYDKRAYTDIVKSAPTNAKIVKAAAIEGAAFRIILYVAPSQGTSTLADVIIAATYMSPRRQLCTDLTVISAVEQQIVVQASITVASGATASGIEAAAIEIINAYINSLPIGGTVSRSRLIVNFLAQPAILGAEIAYPPIDLVLPAQSVATPGTHIISISEV